MSVLQPLLRSGTGCRVSGSIPCSPWTTTVVRKVELYAALVLECPSAWSIHEPSKPYFLLIHFKVKGFKNTSQWLSLRNNLPLSLAEMLSQKPAATLNRQHMRQFIFSPELELNRTASVDMRLATVSSGSNRLWHLAGLPQEKSLLETVERISSWLRRTVDGIPDCLWFRKCLLTVDSYVWEHNSGEGGLH